MIRIGGDISGDLTYQDQLVGLCNKYGMKVIMVFKPTQTMGLEYITLACKTLAERYNGKNGRGFVDYIQVWNETDAILIKAKFGTGGPLGKVFDIFFLVYTHLGDDGILFILLGLIFLLFKKIHRKGRKDCA